MDKNIISVEWPNGENRNRLILKLDNGYEIDIFLTSYAANIEIQKKDKIVSETNFDFGE